MLAFSAIRNGDRVGLIVFTDEVEVFVPPKKGKQHVLRVVSQILSHGPKSRKTSLAAGLEYMGRVSRRPGVVFLISDFQQPVPEYDKALRMASRRHDVVPVHVSDPLESAFPEVGLVDMEDPETGEVFTVDTSGPEARRFRAALAAEKQARETLFKRLAMDPIDVHTDKPYLKALTGFFEARARRMRH